MILRVDEAGRIAFPKLLQTRLGLEPDREVEVVELNEGMLLRPRRRKSAMTRPDGLWIYQGTVPAGFNWDCAVRSIREQRIKTTY